MWKLILLIVFCSCGYNDTKFTEIETQEEMSFFVNENVDFSTIQSQILIPQCLKCHSGNKIRGGIDLETYSKVKSNLQKIEASILSGKMPTSRPLSKSLKNLFSSWVKAGAPEKLVQTGEVPTTNPDPKTPDTVPTPGPKPEEPKPEEPNPKINPITPPVIEPITTAIDFEAIKTQILESKCLRCHSDAKVNKGGVNLETYANVQKHLPLIQSTVMDDEMPPSKPLPDNLKTLLMAWIENGAPENAIMVPSNTESCDDQQHGLMEIGLKLDLGNGQILDLEKNQITNQKIQCKTK